MNQAPQVQSIENIISSQAPAYQSSIDVINQKKAALPGQFEAQRMGLEGQKTNQFNKINNSATARGMSFSGIPLDEQANYLSDVFLPGQQRLVQQQNDMDLELQSALAAIDKERRLGALSTQASQQATLEDYLKEQRAMAWEKEKFNLDMAQRRAEAASSAAGSGADLYSSIFSSLEGRMGGDRYVSGTTWKQLQNYASQYGMSPEQFTSLFGTFQNPKSMTQYGGGQAMSPTPSNKLKVGTAKPGKLTLGRL